MPENIFSPADLEQFGRAVVLRPMFFGVIALYIVLGDSVIETR